MLAAGHAQAKQPVQGSGRVVIVHGLPAEVSEEDIIPHANKVGAVRKRFVQEKNRHVFIEMDSHHQATALVQLLTQILVKGHQLRAELSSRYPQVHEEKVNKVLVLTMPGLSDGQTDCHRLGNLFRSKGVVVRKIQLWSKDGLVSGLVETDSNRSAKLLREQLSGYSMDGAILRLSYSNKESIEIKQLQFGCNFETGEGAGDCPKAGPPPGQQWPPAQPANHHQQPPPPPPPPPGNSRHAYPVGSGQRGQAADAHSHALRTTHEAYDGSGGGYHNGANPYPAPAYIDPIHSHGGKKGGPAPWAAPPAAAPAACVVTVKCLLDGTSPDAVFRLFGICGDVRAVKITKARTTALVQYATPEGAQNAVDRLNDCPWYYETRLLKVYPAHVPGVQGCEDEYTKYYEANDLNHRFNGRSAQKNLDNMHGPNNQLHISNVPIRIPNATVEDALRKYSDNCTTRWIEVKATNEARTKMCIATMDSVRSAVAALVGLHTTSYGPVKGKGIVVSFKHSAPPKATVHPVDSSPLGLIPDPTRPTRHEPDTRYRRPTPDRYNDMNAPGHP